MGSVRRSFRRLSERSGDQASLGDIRYFERDPGSAWLLCDGRVLAATDELRRVLPVETSSFAKPSQAPIISTTATLNLRAAIVGNSLVIPAGRGLFRTIDRGVSFQRVYGGTTDFVDIVTFKGKLVAATPSGTLPLVVSSDGGATWVEWKTISAPGAGFERLEARRLCVVGETLYVLSNGGGQLWKTTDLVNWSAVLLKGYRSGDNAAIDFGWGDGEFVFYTGNIAFYRSTDGVNLTFINEWSRDNLPYYIAFVNGAWITSGPFGSFVRRAGGLFEKAARMIWNPVWTGAEYVGGGGVGKVIVSSDLRTFAEVPIIDGDTSNGSMYHVAEYEDGTLLVLGGSDRYTTCGVTRSLRIPRPAISKRVNRGKPYMRVR